MKGLRSTGLLILLVPAIGACSGGKAGDANATAGATAAATAPGGGARSTASTNRICALYTPSEISGILGATVGDGEAAGPMATACQWSPKGSGDVFLERPLTAMGPPLALRDETPNES